MKRDLGETLLSMLESFSGVGYVLAVLVLLIWIRLLLIAIDEVTHEQDLPRKTRGRRFVHPLRRVSALRSESDNSRQNDAGSIAEHARLGNESSASLLASGSG